MPTGHAPLALVIGAGGQLGRVLVACVPAGWTVRPYDSAALDVTRGDAVRATLARERPTVVFNLAAFTAVDAAESQVAQAEAVNVTGASHVAEAAHAVHARLVHISTDFVFDGAQGRPYAPDDPPNPLNVYGRTKLAGEREVRGIRASDTVIVRTAWLYAARGRNFVHTMLRAMREREEVGVVSDQIGTPTSARSLAQMLWLVAERPEVQGTLHWTDAGVASWYDFAVAIQEEALAAGQLARAVPVRPLRTSDFPTAARRPSYSVLDKEETCRALGATPTHWRVRLRETLAEMARG
jgi:dTDP-4-dehydrorhamnose reductase